jgi:hypothetical protein
MDGARGLPVASQKGGQVSGFHWPVCRWVGGGRQRSLKNPNPRVRDPHR